MTIFEFSLSEPSHSNVLYEIRDFVNVSAAIKIRPCKRKWSEISRIRISHLLLFIPGATIDSSYTRFCWLCQVWADSRHETSHSPAAGANLDLLFDAHDREWMISLQPTANFRCKRITRDLFNIVEWSSFSLSRQSRVQ
jgi:hypothetical protein